VLGLSKVSRERVWREGGLRVVKAVAGSGPVSACPT